MNKWEVTSFPSALMVLIWMCNRMVSVTLPVDSIPAEGSRAQGGKTFRKHCKARCWAICAETAESHSEPFLCICGSCNSSLNMRWWFKRLKKNGFWQRIVLPTRQGGASYPLPTGREWHLTKLERRYEFLQVSGTQGLVPDPPLCGLKAEAWGWPVALTRGRAESSGRFGMSWPFIDGGNTEWPFPLASWALRGKR